MSSSKNQLSKSQIALMSATAGICVANIYYNQPLLSDMAKSLHTSESAIGNTAVWAQAGYGIGLFFITPLGDILNRRKLILILQLLLCVALIGNALAPSIPLLLLCSVFIGLFSVAAQVILPMAAFLSPENKGKVVGIIFTGILSGILAARVFSGFIADWLNWRDVYFIAACLVFISSIFLYRSLPNINPVFNGNYKSLLSSTIYQLKRFSLLRNTALLGALMFGVFCSFWTTLTFHLSAAPFNYNTDIIGLFGILAIVSALLAPYFGKLADKGGTTKSRLIAIGLVIIAALLSLLFSNFLWSMICAVLLLDLGVQAVQVTNVAIIYGLDESAHSRINTVYMTAYFIGGSLGTFTGLHCWKAGGWHFVCVQLLVLSLIAFILPFMNRNKKVQMS